MAISKRTKTVLTIAGLAIAAFFAWRQWGPKIDSTGARWTIGAGNAIFRNGVKTDGVAGTGKTISIVSGTAYVIGTDGRSYMWSGSTWTPAS